MHDKSNGESSGTPMSPLPAAILGLALEALMPLPVVLKLVRLVIDGLDSCALPSTLSAGSSVNRASLKLPLKRDMARGEPLFRSAG